MTTSDRKAGDERIPPHLATDDTLARTSTEGTVSLAALATAVLAHRSLISRLVLLACGVVLLDVFLPPRTYTSKASIMPQSGRLPSNLAGLASQFGLAVPGVETGANLYLYSKLLSSVQVLREVVKTSYPLPGGRARQGSLIDYLRIATPDSARAAELAVRRVQDWINVGVNRDAGIVELRVKTRDAHLSSAVSNRMLQVLDSLNLAIRRSHAGDERRFAEQRVLEARRELLQAEERLQSFLEKNRDYRSSPLLIFNQERLARDISLRQQVLTGLSQAFEQAKIDEVRDIPAIAVVESPFPPGLPDSRHAAVKLVLAVVGALSAGILMAILRWTAGSEYVSAAEGAARLRAEWREAKTEFRRPWRLLRPTMPADGP
jgi:uncharacterized protein involved in exopolysaccharide biosynthesis